MLIFSSAAAAAREQRRRRRKEIAGRKGRGRGRSRSRGRDHDEDEGDEEGEDEDKEEDALLSECGRYVELCMDDSHLTRSGSSSSSSGQRSSTRGAGVVVVKLADFGLSRRLNAGTRRTLRTLAAAEERSKKKRQRRKLRPRKRSSSNPATAAGNDDGNNVDSNDDDDDDDPEDDGLFARRLPPTPRACLSVVGTEMYMAPEMADKKNYGKSADVYSLGVALMEIAGCGQVRDRRKGERHSAWVESHLQLVPECYNARSSLLVLLRAMTEKDPAKRITMDRALHSPLVQLLLRSGGSATILGNVPRPVQWMGGGGAGSRRRSSGGSASFAPEAGSNHGAGASVSGEPSVVVSAETWRAMVAELNSRAAAPMYAQPSLGGVGGGRGGGSGSGSGFAPGYYSGNMGAGPQFSLTGRGAGGGGMPAAYSRSQAYPQNNRGASSLPRDMGVFHVGAASAPAKQRRSRLQPLPVGPTTMARATGRRTTTTATATGMRSQGSKVRVTAPSTQPHGSAIALRRPRRQRRQAPPMVPKHLVSASAAPVVGSPYFSSGSRRSSVGSVASSTASVSPSMPITPGYQVDV